MKPQTFGALLVFFASWELQTSSAAEPLIFVHAKLVDVIGGSTRPDVSVTVEGERITQIGNSAEIRPPTNATIVDTQGGWLIPGLWDMHAHPMEEEDYLPLFIANGVTGVRVMWGLPVHHAWRKRITNGGMVGPRMWIGSAIVDGPRPIWPGSTAVSNVFQARQVVASAKKEGADFIKVYSLLPRDAYLAIADEARSQSIAFVGHVPLSVSAQEASEAGQRSMEHLFGILPACSTLQPQLYQSAQQVLTNTDAIGFFRFLMRESKLAAESFSPAKAGELSAILAHNSSWQCPTLITTHNIFYLRDASVTNDARLRYVPQRTRAEWNGAKDLFNPPDTPVADTIFRRQLEIVGAMERAGVGLLAGSDCGSPFTFPGFSLHDELRFLVQAGLTPLQALQTATILPARFLGRESEMGTISRGKVADLVLLDGNPLEDINNTKRIRAVVAAGRLFTRSRLDDMIARAEKTASSP